MNGVLRHPEGSATFEGRFAVSECTFMGAASRQFGQATLTLARDHPAIRNGVVPRLGGLRVFIHTAWFPTWHGIVLDTPARNADGTFGYTAHEIGALSSHVEVASGRTFAYAPAGVIFEAAVTEALDGRPIASLGRGSFLKASPLIPSYVFERKTLQQIAVELADLTKQEWEIDEAGQIHWTAPTGSVYEPTLIEGHDLIWDGETVDTTNRIARVTAFDRYGRSAVASAPELIGDITAREITINVDTDDQATLQAHADAELEIGRVPSVTFSVYLQPGGTGTLTFGFGDGPFGLDPFGGVGGGAPHWIGIRPGTFVSCVLPSAGERGEPVVCRVLSITLGDHLPMPRLVLQQIHLLNAFTRPRVQHGNSPPPNRRTDILAQIAAGIGVSGRLVTPEQLAAIPAKKIAGTFGDGQISDLAADKITGTLTDAQIADLAASKLTGTVADAQIAAVAASKVTGTLTNSQIADLAASKLTGTVADAQIAGMNANKLSGTLDPARIAASTITNTHLDDGIDEAKIDWQTAASAGAATGEYLVLTIGGVPRKFEILANS